jgi:hypothetical protein
MGGTAKKWASVCPFERPDGPMSLPNQPVFLSEREVDIPVRETGAYLTHTLETRRYLTFDNENPPTRTARLRPYPKSSERPKERSALRQHW